MAYPYPGLFALDPSDPANVAADAELTIFDPADPTLAPVQLTDQTGMVLPNPVTTNKHGFVGPFYSELEQVGWSAGGMTGLEASFVGLKNEAVAASASAGDSATAALAAADNAAAGVAATFSDLTTRAETAEQAAVNAAGLVGAPAGAAVLAAISPGGAAESQLNAAIGLFSGVRPENYGAAGDGIADDGAALVSAMSAAVTFGVPVILSERTYGVNSMITAPVGLIVESRRATIKQLASFGNYGIKFVGNNTVRGSLTVLTGSTDTNVRGIFVEGGNFRADDLTVTSPIPLAGAGDSYRRGFYILGKNARIGTLSVTDFDYPAVIESSDNVTIDRIELRNYVRGLYVSQSTDVWVNGGEISGASANALSVPGHNGVLIGANSNEGTGDLHFTNIKVEGAGEHGWRIGGDKKVKRAWFTNCSAINTGGCGFKILGGTLEVPNTHDDLFLTDCIAEDCGQANAAHAGFMLELVTNAVVTNPVVRRKSKTYSAGAGVEIQAATNIQVVNPNISDTLEYGYRVGFVLGNCTDVKLVGGTITCSVGKCISIEYTNRTFRRVSVEGHPQMGPTGTAKALSVVNSGTGTVIGGSWLTFQSVSAASSLIDTAADTAYGAYFADVRANFVDTAFKNGTVWVDNVTGIYRIKNATWKTPAA